MKTKETESFRKILAVTDGLTSAQIDDTMHYFAGTPLIYAEGK